MKLTTKLEADAFFASQVEFIINGQVYHFTSFRISELLDETSILWGGPGIVELILEAEDNELKYCWRFMQYIVTTWRDYGEDPFRPIKYSFYPNQDAPICAAIVEHKWKAIKVWVNNTGPFNGQIFPTT